jgi:hypothetical protein
MQLKTSLIAVAGALAFGLVGTSAQAAPLGSIGDVKTNAAQESNVYDVRWRERCRWGSDGEYHCNRYWRRHYEHSGPYFYDDNYSYYGYGYGPSLGLYFGGRDHHHRHHRHHRHNRHR